MKLKTSVTAVEKEDGIYVFELHAKLDLAEEECHILGKYQGGISQLLPMEDWRGVLGNTLEQVAVYDDREYIFAPAKAENLESLIDGVTFRSANIRQIAELEDDLASIVIDTQEAMDNIRRYMKK